MILTIAPILLYFLAWQTAAKNVWPCSQQTTIDGNGVEVWNCAHNNDEPETVYKGDHCSISLSYEFTPPLT